MGDYPVEITNSLEQFKKDHPDPSKVAFIMMQFGGTQLHDRIVTALKDTLAASGITGVRADDKPYHPDLWPNILTYMHGSGFGIAVFERLEDENFNPNVSLEVGYMMALGKRVCLLKDKTLKALHTDLVGKLYVSFDPQSAPKSISRVLKKWLEDHQPLWLPSRPVPTVIEAQRRSLQASFALVKSRGWSGDRAAMEVVNDGDVDLHIRKVVLKYVIAETGGRTTNCSVELVPDSDLPGSDLVVPRKPINEESANPQWKRHYYLHCREPRDTRHILQAAAEADPSSFRLEVWADEDPDKPIWSAKGDELAGLYSVIRHHWQFIVKHHPAYPEVRRLLGLGADDVFSHWQGLIDLASKRGYRDCTEGDAHNYYLCAFRHAEGLHIFRISRSVFDGEGKLLPMLQEEWKVEMVGLELRRPEATVDGMGQTEDRDEYEY